MDSMLHNDNSRLNVWKVVEVSLVGVVEVSRMKEVKAKMEHSALKRTFGDKKEHIRFAGIVITHMRFILTKIPRFFVIFQNMS
jgi:hypothetical protein